LPARDLPFFTGCGCDNLILPSDFDASNPNTYTEYLSGVITFYSDTLKCIKVNPFKFLTNCRSLIIGIIDLVCVFAKSCCSEIELCDLGQQLKNMLSFITETSLIFFETSTLIERFIEKLESLKNCQL